MIRTRYNVHQAATTQSRAIHSKYKGRVDFKGGAYGILKAAVERELEMERGVGGTSTGLLQPDQDLQRRQRAVELKERELQAKEREIELKKRELDMVEREQALKAKTGVALHSQVISNHTLFTVHRL